MIRMIKIALVLGLYSSFLIHGAEIPAQNWDVSIQCSDGTVHLTQQEWASLVNASETMRDLANNSQQPEDNAVVLDMSTMNKERLKRVLSLIQNQTDINKKLQTLNFEEQLYLFGDSDFLNIPSILHPLNPIIIEGLSADKGNFLKEFSKNKQDAVIRLSSYGIDMSNTDIGYGMIKPRLNDLWAPSVMRLTGHTNDITSVAWSPDGTKAASGSWDNTIRVNDSRTGALLLTITGHTDAITSVAWSPDGTKIASGSRDETVCIWNAATGQLLKTLRPPAASVITSVAWSPDSTKIASGSRDETVCIWDAATGQLLNVLNGHTDIVTSVAWSPDGTKIASGSQDKTVRIWHADTGQPLNVLNGHTDIVTSVAWSPEWHQDCLRFV